MARVPKVKFTRHAFEKFGVLKRYDFEISVGRVMFAVLNPTRLERRDGQFFAVKLLDSKYALRWFMRSGKAF